MTVLFVLTILLVAEVLESARILVLQPTPARGHSTVTEPLFEALAARGHHLTVVTSYPHHPPLPNLEEIDVSEETLVKRWQSNVTVKTIKDNMPNQWKSPPFMNVNEHFECEVLYSSDKIKTLLQSNETFDLVITEIFTNDCFAPFAFKFKAPLVSVVTSCAFPWTGDRVGLPDNPAYIPNYYVDVGNHMSFTERIYNTLFWIYTKLLYRYKFIPRAQVLVNKYFDEKLPPITEIVKNTSLILINSYFSLTYSRPLPPNVIEVGGIHIRNSSKTLPKDLQEILDKSFQGVVFVSFGSMVRVSSLPKHVITTFLTSFSKIPQTVILKYEEDLTDVPKNVILKKWLPQRQMIEHKNVKAALIHGGLASTTEAVYFGKPIIGVPVFSDQFLNLKTISRLGAGVMLDLDDITEEKLDSALHQVLNDPRYSTRAKQLSQQFRDRPIPALQTAVFWTEYVLRHRGAPHLRPTSVDLTIWQYLLLDVTLVVLAAVLSLSYLSYFLISAVLRVMVRRRLIKSKKTD